MIFNIFNTRFIMSYSYRRSRIEKLLSEKPFVSLAELCEIFPDVTSMTLRRDLEYFENKGEAIKVRGGARSMKFLTATMEDSFTSRINENTNIKEKLAARASEYVEAGRSLFFDSGTTVLTMVKYIPESRYSVITTGPNIAMELSKKKSIIVNLVGGMLNKESLSISGTDATQYLSGLNIDIAFIVPSGISAESGLTCGNYAECDVKKLVVSKARKTVVLLDTAKVNRVLPYTFAPLEAIDTIICDSPLTGELADAAGKAGCNIITV